MSEIVKFCEEVLYHIPRATKAEREDIRAELEAHLTDHRDARIEEGMDYREAVLAATQAMGDPREIGQAMNEQLSPFWLRLEKSFWFFLVTAFLVLHISLTPVVHLTQAVAVRVAPGLVFDLQLDQWNSRYSPMALELKEQGYTLREDVDVRMTLGNEELRICRLYMDPTPGNPRVAVAMVVYNRNLMGYVSNNIWHMNFQSQRQEGCDGSVGDVVGIALRYNIPVYPGDTYVTLIYKRFGEERTLQVPIPWEVTP